VYNMIKNKMCSTIMMDTYILRSYFIILSRGGVGRALPAFGWGRKKVCHRESCMYEVQIEVKGS
jgi:hypothetical protein